VIRAESSPLAVQAEQPRAASRPLATWRRILLPAAVFVAALLVLGFEASVAPFEADEADYVATSRYFGYLVLKHDVARQEWGSNHWTRTQPPLTRYIVGGWLTAYGYDLEKMNQPYVSTASSYEVNRQKGRVPTDDVLARARQPMVLLGAGAVVGLFLLGALLGGNVAGLAVVALALTSAFLRYTLVHAWAEAPLAFFLVLSALLAAVGVQRVSEGRRWGRWAVALGLALGLASATKLTGLVGISITVGVAVVLAAVAWRRGDPAATRRLLAWSMIAAALALVVFMVVNPYLWRGPVSGMLGMLEERRDEMAFQQEQWPEFAVLTFSERPWLTAVGSTRVGPWSDVPEAAVLLGLALAALGIWAAVRSAGTIGPASVAMLLAWLIGYTAAIVAGLGLSYPRYFLPACLLLLPFMGAGVSFAASRWLPLARVRERGAGGEGKS
jgi:Dolichyl-phosphate-mannose-protein mannosyltransferase